MYDSDNKSLKENHRLASILRILSKTLERNMFQQMSSFFGLRKASSTQLSLLDLLDKWKRSIDRCKVFGALLTDLSKASDCLNPDLLKAEKLNAYGFKLPAFKLLDDYLLNRKQITKINNP